MKRTAGMRAVALLTLFVIPLVANPLHATVTECGVSADGSSDKCCNSTGQCLIGFGALNQSASGQSDDLFVGAGILFQGSGWNPGVPVEIFWDPSNIGTCTPPSSGTFNNGGTTADNTIALPGGPTEPTTGPGSLVVSNKGSTGSYSLKSNAVAVPIGQQITLTSVSQSGSTITVIGAGFSSLSVINFFNVQGGGVVNLGGLGPRGAPKIPLTLSSSDKFTFTMPTGAVPGAAYVLALNPPFVPFSSMGNSPAGAFTLK